MTGDTFVSWFDPTVVCTSVWNGGPLIAHGATGEGMPSSLLNVSPSEQPAKPVKAGATRPQSLTRQTVAGRGH